MPDFQKITRHTSYRVAKRLCPQKIKIGSFSISYKENFTVKTNYFLDTY